MNKIERQKLELLIKSKSILADCNKLASHSLNYQKDKIAMQQFIKAIRKRIHWAANCGDMFAMIKQYANKHLSGTVRAHSAVMKMADKLCFGNQDIYFAF